MRRALVLFVAFVLAVWTPAAAQTRELVMGNINPAKHGTTQAAQQFADKLGELTQGKIKVIHHHSGALGGEREVAQQVQLGTIDLTPVTAAPLATLIPDSFFFIVAMFCSNRSRSTQSAGVSRSHFDTPTRLPSSALSRISASE